MTSVFGGRGGVCSLLVLIAAMLSVTSLQTKITCANNNIPLQPIYPISYTLLKLAQHDQPLLSRMLLNTVRACGCSNEA